MDERDLKRRIKITSKLPWLFLIGLDATAAIVATTRSHPVVLIPFGLATLVTIGMVWWAHRSNNRLAAPPFGAVKITPDSSHAQQTKPIDWDYPLELRRKSHGKGIRMNKKQQQAIALRRARQKKVRAIIFGLITVIVLGLSVALLVSAFSPKTPPPAVNTIDISADMGGFNMQEIRVKAGKPVTIRLTSLDNSHHTDGGGQHQWAVDEFGVSVVAPAEGTNFITFTPDKPGMYTYYCDICCGGRANPTMQGKLIVEA